MSPAAPDWDMIGRYVAGESSPDEAATVRRWLETHPGDAALVAALDDAAKESATAAVGPVDVEAALRRVKARVRSHSRKTAWSLAGFAAAAAVLFVASQIMKRDAPGERESTVALVPFSTGIGQRDSIRLADGSSVTLGPDSRIEILGGAQREIRLEGEAFFRVVHDARQPFVVHAGATRIRDVGTKFSVHNDRSESVRVVVHEGAVIVTYRSDSVTLNPGDVGVVAPDGVAANRGAATPDDLAWTQGRLVFRNAPLPQLTEDLRRWYGVELRVLDSSLFRRHFTGSFAGEPVGRVLDVIGLALGATVERRGDTAFVRVAPAGR